MGTIIRTKFSVGDTVQHRLFDYRGVIVDVDPEFLASDEWYQAMAKSGPPKDKPWYHVLVHDASHTTYVAEQNLMPDKSLDPIHHPLLPLYFNSYEEGRYKSATPMN